MKAGASGAPAERAEVASAGGRPAMNVDGLRDRLEGWPPDLVAAAVGAALATHRPDITEEERPVLARMIAMALADPEAPQPPLDAVTIAAIVRNLQRRVV